MDGGIMEQEEYENSPENSGDSPPPSGVFSDSKMTSTSSPKRSRRAVQKRVVSVPIKDVEGSGLKGEMSTPPSDSWAWRKYGQKPIKGSPYPRGYYRCSSSKGCPARKQVERSRADPTKLMVTYSCEHNHGWPASKNNRDRNHNIQKISASTTTIVSTLSANVITSNSEDDQNPIIFEMDEKFSNLEGSLITEFGWFSNLETTCSTLLESPFLDKDNIGDIDVTTIFSSRDEDESLFADLGELPECSLVFRRVMGREEDRRQCSLTPFCRTKG